jgi:serine/threonine protein kinase
MDNVPVSTPGRRYLADRYRLEEVLGRGATGTVWAAYDEVLRRRVAIKEVPPPPGMPDAEADELRERTLREARAIAVLTHPNVVTVFDVVRQDGEPFVVMELLPAKSLATVIGERGPLDTGGAALVGHAVASALQAAHDAGITHRDVKPGNVLIGTGPDDGRIKLTDFGIARNVAEASLTMTGMMLGSPAFIAPEVASGGVVGPAADRWGLGATLFAAVQGRPPYDAGEPLATVAAVVHGEVPTPTSAGPLAPVICGLMVKDPAARMPLAEVCRQLRPLLPPDGRVLHDGGDTRVIVAPDPAAAPVRLPGQPGPPATAGPSVTPGPAVTAEPAGDGGQARTLIDPDTPLAADPGPLPFPPQPVPSAPTTAETAIVATPPSEARLDWLFADQPYPDRPFEVQPYPDQPLTAPPWPAPPSHSSHATQPSHGSQASQPSVPVPRRRSRLASVALALAVALFFAGGAAGGFGLSRWAAGAPLLPELGRREPASSTTTEPPAQDQLTVQSQPVSVTDDQPGTKEPMVSTFTIGVPEGWSTYRPPLGYPEAKASAEPRIVALFLSPDGSRTIAVDRLPGFYPKGNVGSYLSAVEDKLVDSVDDVVVQPVNAVGPPAAGATEGPFETSFRTVERGTGGASRELLRTTLLYLRPTATDLWVVRVTVPSDQQKSADPLYSAVVGSFAPP